MTPDYIVITPWQLFLASLLVLINVALSVWLRLGLTRSLIIASVRMTVQLILIGYVLNWVFHQSSPWIILLLAGIMTTIAGISAVGRTKRRFASIYWDSTVSVFAASFLVTGISLKGILGVRPWYEAQYLIPLLGMVLGNALNGISLALDRFVEGLYSQQSQVETHLALGATAWEAAHDLVREALRVAMVPTINSMMVMGLVSLPGMMTGQILAGARPVDAVRYQIVIIFMITAGTALGAIGVVLLAFRALFSQRHQLLLGRLTTR